MLLAPLKRGKKGLQKPIINIIITTITRHVVGSWPMKRKKKE